MADKTEQSGQVSSDDFKDHGSKGNLNKFEYDLYHEEDDLSFKVIRVKHISLPNKGDKWKIFEDNKLINSIDGAKLTNKEKDFLKTTNGIIWLLEVVKLGITSFSSFKKDLKKKLSS
jgi:hypothetical protein